MKDYVMPQDEFTICDGNAAGEIRLEYWGDDGIEYFIPLDDVTDWARCREQLRSYNLDFSKEALGMYQIMAYCRLLLFCDLLGGWSTPETRNKQ